VATKSGFSEIIVVSFSMSRTANAPHPPLGDFRTSKYSVVKRCDTSEDEDEVVEEVEEEGVSVGGAAGVEAGVRPREKAEDGEIGGDGSKAAFLKDVSSCRCLDLPTLALATAAGAPYAFFLKLVRDLRIR